MVDRVIIIVEEKMLQGRFYGGDVTINGIIIMVAEMKLQRRCYGGEGMLWYFKLALV